MLRQPVLEDRRQLLLDGVGTCAVDAALEVRAHVALRRQRQAPAMIVDQPEPDVVARHRA